MTTVVDDGDTQQHHHGTSKSKKNILLVGIGNEYRRDDSVGVTVARRVKSIVGDRDGIDVVEVSDASNLLDIIQMDYTRLIIVDAVYSNSQIGTIHRFSRDELLNMDRYIQSQPSPSSTHAMDIVGALKLAEALGITQDVDVVVFGIEGKDFSLGEGLSRELEESIDRIVEVIMREISA